MHRYIEWNNLDKKFQEPKCGCGLTINELFNTFDNTENFSIFKYIGKVDIDNNFIFERSSIVEIGFSWQNSEDRIKGYFVYDNSCLKYVIWDINKNDFIDFDITKMQYFKIIDTVQENKLGLIKNH